MHLEISSIEEARKLLLMLKKDQKIVVECEMCQSEIKVLYKNVLNVPQFSITFCDNDDIVEIYTIDVMANILYGANLVTGNSHLETN